MSAMFDRIRRGEDVVQRMMYLRWSQHSVKSRRLRVTHHETLIITSILSEGLLRRRVDLLVRFVGLYRDVTRSIADERSMATVQFEQLVRNATLLSMYGVPAFGEATRPVRDSETREGREVGLTQQASKPETDEREEGERNDRKLYGSHSYITSS